MAEIEPPKSPSVCDEPPSSFRVKPIQFGTKIVTICLQNENGPCPLLAICNVLLLRGEMFIHPDQSYVSLEELLNQLHSVIMTKKPSVFSSEGEQKNYEENITATMASYHELSRGLDVNVRFSGVFGFEFTVQMAVFDLTHVQLCHGWLPDPTSKAHPLVSRSSYNQLVEHVIHAREVSPRGEPSSSSPQEPVASSSNDAGANTPPAASEQDLARAENGHIIDDWLNETSSQLTFHGITKLYEELREGQLYVFFRNNHFSTLLMKEASLWILMTDQGFAKQAAVWEKLDSVDGDSYFVTAQFEHFTADSTPYQVDTNIAGQDVQTSLDAQLAQQLQEAEHQKAERSRAKSQTGRAAAPPPASAKKRPLTQSAPGGRRPPQSQAPASTAPPGNAKSKPKRKDDDDCTIL